MKTALNTDRQLELATTLLRQAAIPNPEFIRLPKSPKLCQYTGLSRSKLNELILPMAANGFDPPVRSFNVRNRGQMKGVRLIVFDSLMGYLRDQAHQQLQKFSGENATSVRVAKSESVRNTTKRKKQSNMLLKSNKTASTLVPEGEYVATLRTVRTKGEKKAFLDLQPQGFESLVPCECEASLDKGPLRKYLEIIRGTPFSLVEIQNGIDPEKCVGGKCRVVVQHRKASGGKTVAFCQVILPLPADYPRQA